MKDFIYCKKNVLSKEIFDNIITIFNENPHKWQEGKMIRGVDPKAKKCTEVYVNALEKNPFNRLFNASVVLPTSMRFLSRLIPILWNIFCGILTF